MTTKALIGIDVGTTSVKAVMTDLEGRRLADYAHEYPTSRPVPGWAEQDPSDWLSHVVAALEHFAAIPARIQGIGITSQVNTHVFCDRDFVPLAPAIVWQDGRATAQGAALESKISLDARIAALGAPIPIDASHALSRMAWMAAERPDLWHRTAWVMAPKDWIIARLSGVAGADPIASVGLAGPDLRYANPIVALMEGAAQCLPPLSDPLTPAGAMTSGPFQGVPLIRGTMDAWAAMFGVGMSREGQAMNLSGTSEVISLISARRNPVHGVISFPPWRDITLHAGPTQSGGASLAWLGRLMGKDAAGLAGLVAGQNISAEAPLFLPHLQGERAPLWDMQARGTFAGLSTVSGPAEVTLAVMEGVAFSARLALEALEQAGGLRPEVIRIGGGGTASDDWCQIRANAFGRPVWRMAARDAGAVGALVMAGAGLELMPDLARAAEKLVHRDRIFMPDAGGARRADQRFAIWCTLYEQVRPVHARLGALD